MKEWSTAAVWESTFRAAYARPESRGDLSVGPTALMVVVVGARRAREAQRRLDAVIVDAGGRIGRRG